MVRTSSRCTTISEKRKVSALKDSISMFLSLINSKHTNQISTDPLERTIICCYFFATQKAVSSSLNIKDSGLGSTKWILLLNIFN